MNTPSHSNAGEKTSESDSNALAFERLKNLIKEDKTLPEEVTKALLADIETKSPRLTQLRQLFEAKDASAQ